jgi:O-antigen/teichoic acid export membrane protein
MFDWIPWNVIGGLSFSSVLGSIILFFLSNWLHKRVESQYPDLIQGAQRFPALSTAVGFFERVVYTCLFALDISAAGAFVGTWILAKMVSGWNRLKRDEIQYRKRSFIGLLLNLISILFALAGACIWNPGLLPP